MTTTANTDMPAAASTERWDVAVYAGTAGFVVGVLVTQIVLAGGVIPPLDVFAVLMIAALVVRRSRGKAGNIMAAVVGVLAVLTSLPFLLTDLLHPADAAVQFIVSAAMLASVVVLVVGALASLRGWRPAVAPALLIGAAAVVVLAGLAALIAAGAQDSDTASAGDVTVNAKNVEFKPDAIALTKGQGVLVKNGDLVRHTFDVEDTDVSVSVPAGRSRRAAINLAPGTYQFHCDVPGHESMKGTLTVR